MGNKMTVNFDAKEQIRDFWSRRAARFDESFSHSITEGPELEAWKTAYRSLMGEDKLNILELGSGTGEVSKVLMELGHTITGIDFSENMLSRAKDKHAEFTDRVSYYLGDAESTNQPDDEYDAVTCRHLVWTLLDPKAALADWYRVTKPNGHLIVFDGNFMAQRTQDRFLRGILAGMDKFSKSPGHLPKEVRALHDKIKPQLYFSKGLSFDVLSGLVFEAGYRNITFHSYEPIRAGQRKVVTPFNSPKDWLRTFIGDRFILHAQKI